MTTVDVPAECRRAKAARAYLERCAQARAAKDAAEKAARERRERILTFWALIALALVILISYARAKDEWRREHDLAHPAQAGAYPPQNHRPGPFALLSGPGHLFGGRA